MVRQSGCVNNFHNYTICRRWVKLIKKCLGVHAVETLGSVKYDNINSTFAVLNFSLRLSGSTWGWLLRYDGG